jgi:acetylornithine deacetylase/succinyl-diaminopimelate desuccinylase-like protein
MSPLPAASEIARDLVAIPTVNPPGLEAAAQQVVASVLDNSGIDVQVFEKEPGRPNLVARLSGGDDRPGLVLHGHVDVVGVEGQSWRHPPFGGHVEADVLHGRGALDMKSGVAMMCHAFCRAVVDGVRPAGDVLLVIVADSETGGSAGLAYMLEEHGEVFDGVGYAVGEFGGFPLNLMGQKLYAIGVSQKQYAHLRLRLDGGGGHGSALTTKTVMGRLGQLLLDLDRIHLPYHKTPVVERVVEEIAMAVPEKEQALTRLLDRSQFEDALTVLGTDRQTLEALFRDTANPTVVAAGAKFNVIPSEAVVEVDARLLPGRSVDDLLASIRSVVGAEIDIEIVAAGSGGPENFDDTLFPTLASILREMDPTGRPIPYLFNESPDGRLFHERGIQHYGFLPMNLPPDIDLPSLIHGPNERVPLAAVDFGAEALHRLIRDY